MGIYGDNGEENGTDYLRGYIEMYRRAWGFMLWA